MTPSLTIIVDSTGTTPQFHFDGPLEISDETRHELCRAICAVLWKGLGQSIRFHEGAWWLFLQDKPERALTPGEIARHVSPSAHDLN